MLHGPHFGQNVRAMGPADPSDRRATATWLFICCALVFLMVVVGGITRLTHSGLSIVEWQPVAGVLPPMNDAQWQEVFDKYRQTPEYRDRNPGMDVAGFKKIFWWEYAHRLLGRLIGVVFLLPFLWFLSRGRLDGDVAWKLGGIFILGGLQGGLGWFMVQSGLVQEPRVDSLRLAAHLGLAFVIYGWMLWVALDLIRRERLPNTDGLRGRTGGMLALVFLQVLAGALVAGIHAGKAYNTWPLMDGHFIPPDIAVLEPWWANLAYNMATTQFTHRILAIAVALMAIGVWFDVRRDLPNPRARFWSTLLVIAVGLQFAVGVATLLAGVPLGLGVLHQAGAVLVFSVALALRHALREQKQFQM
jgi:cytochrome c oxidase assembly protein subunit 15